MADIFVSYARQDFDRAQALVKLLEDQGWSVWWDKEIGPGSSFSRVIEQEIAKAKCVLVLWTSRSVESEWVNAEASEGLARQILIPVLLEDVRAPLVFRQMQACNLISWPARAKPDDVASLLAAVSTAIERPVIIAPQAKRVSFFSLPVLTIAGVLLASVLGFSYHRYMSGSSPAADTPATSEPDSIVTIMVSPFRDMPGDIASEIAALLARASRIQVRRPEYEAGVAAGQADYSLRGVQVEQRLAVSLYDNQLEQTRLNFEIDLNNTSVLKATRTIVKRVSQEFDDAVSLNEPAVGNDAYLAYLGLQARANRQLSVDERRAVAGELQKLIDTSPRFAEAVAGLCSCFLSIYSQTRNVGDFAAAERNCVRAARLDNSNPWVDIAMGDLYRTAGQFKDAEHSYARALQTSRYLTPALVGLARIADRRDDLPGARSLILEAQSYEPNNWQLFESLGAIYFKRGDYVEAAEQYERVAALTEDKPFVLNDLGSAYYLQGDFVRAIDKWEKSVAAEPNYAAYSNLGSAYFFERQFDLALAAYEQASKLNDKDYRMWLNSGEAAYFLPRVDSNPYYARATRLAEQAWAINPDAADVLSALALAHASLGEQERARYYINAAIANSSDIYVLYDVAVAYTRLGEQADAEKTLQKMVSNGYPQLLVEKDANFTTIGEIE